MMKLIDRLVVYCFICCLVLGIMVIAGATFSNDAFLYVSLTLFVEAGIVSVVVGVLYTLQDVLQS